MVSLVIAYHSGYGHTERLAHAIAEGAMEHAQTSAKLLRVETINEDGWRQLAEADAIIFGAPTYMGGASGQFKLFADASAKVWLPQGWVDKIAGGFTCSGHMSGDKLATLQSFAILAMQHGMIWVGPAQAPPSEPGDPDALNRLGSWLGLMAQADNVPAEESPPEGDIDSARAYGRRLALSCARWSKGVGASAR